MPARGSNSVPTRHGQVHVEDISPGTGHPSEQALLLLHGNSSNSQIFKHMLAASDLPFRRIAIDLPGHGRSADASDPDRGYTQRGYAEAAVDVLRHLAVREYVVLGWSLGGHIAIEMLGLLGQAGEVSDGSDKGDGELRCKGLLITGTPPANGPIEVPESFDPSDGAARVQKPAEDDGEHMNWAGAEFWPEQVYDEFPFEGAGRPHEAWMRDAAKRTDGRARRIMWESFAGGKGIDQRKVVATSEVPCAVVNGAAEPFVNLRLIDRLKFNNLWEGKQHLLSSKDSRELGHTPFWEEPELFSQTLVRFLGDCFQA